MDEYDRLVEKFPAGITAYVYGSYAKGSYIRGPSDVDVVLFVESMAEGFRFLRAFNPVELSMLDVTIYMPKMTGTPRLRAYIASRFGRPVAGKPVEIILEEPELRRLILAAASESVNRIYKITYTYSDSAELLEALADEFLGLCSLYLMSRGYLEATKPEVIDYELPREIVRVARKAFDLKYAYVRRITPGELLRATEALVSKF